MLTANPKTSAQGEGTTLRRHDVDALRVGALALLIVYHIAISFQPWAFTLLFPQNEEPIQGLWTLMSMVNVWRIPILFLISGMDVRFAMERRSWLGLLKDRAIRILLPLAFGFVLLCPLSTILALGFYNRPLEYLPNPLHLWFLGNIFVYVVVLLPLLVYLKQRPESWLLRSIDRLLRSPGSLALFAIPLVLEPWIVKPQVYTLYALTPHGFWLGLVCFLTGFVFVSVGQRFWHAAERCRHGALGVAFLLYLSRTFWLQQQIEPLMGLESLAWMIALLGYASRHLNRPSRPLAYLSAAVYPVYILHIPVQFGLSHLILPLELPPTFKLALLLLGTFALCLALYEWPLRRLRWIRPLFGMKLGQV